ncbi:carboxypeptidase regulatory-like domain-containing protein [Lacinutrix sp.]|uniref:carboxypeptidase regulatory-like domain-containing protein n=1 Tax=Lacinutrix sp. TaxID=1937692 RepID=UPI0025C33972|nr:carboxypeptidase regulatory-like domain-containing protein [Lacinutrix sp.]
MKKIKHIINLLIIMLFIMACSEDQIDGIRIGSINGKVVAEGTNAPLENVKISTNPVTSTVFTDVDGNFVIDNAVVETYAVQAELDGFVTAFESVTVLENTAAAAAFELVTSNANNQSPTSPDLIFPEDLAIEVPLEIEFTWNSLDLDVNDELSYTLELRNGSTNEVEMYEVEQDTFYVANNLQLSTTYFWQVTVNDDINEDVISAVSQFSTITVPNNPFVFIREENGNSVIYSGKEDPEGGAEAELDFDLLKLTNESNNSFRPRSNVAINKIAYLRTVGGSTQLFTMNTDGSNQTQVTSTIPVNGFRLEHVDFCWAQSGSKLYYPSFDKLYQINPDGSGLLQIYQTTDGSFISEVESVAFDNDLILVKTNNSLGYNARLFTVRLSTGTEDAIVVEGLPGAIGGIDITANADEIIYTRDLSGSQNSTYRQFQSRVFIYNVATTTSTQVPTDALIGFNDLDVKYAPNEGGFILTRVSNAINSVPRIFIYQFGIATAETELFTAASMPDWD